MLKTIGLSKKSISKELGIDNGEVIRFSVDSSDSSLNQKIV